MSEDLELHPGALKSARTARPFDPEALIRALVSIARTQTELASAIQRIGLHMTEKERSDLDVAKEILSDIKGATQQMNATVEALQAMRESMR